MSFSLPCPCAFQLVKLHTDTINSDQQFPLLAANARSELDRDVEYTLNGLDKLYTASTSLTRDQIKQSSEMVDDRLAKKLATIKERLDKKREEWHDLGSPILKDASADLDAALGPEWQILENQVIVVRNQEMSLLIIHR